MLAPFALNALSDGERRAVMAHLASCSRHDVEVREFRIVTADAASGAAGPLAETLRSDLARALSRAAAAPRDGLRRVLLAGPAVAYGVIVALAIVVAVAAVWTLSASDRDQAVAGAVRWSGPTLSVLYLPKEGVVVLDVNLPAPGPDRTYQAWKVDRAGQPRALGIVGSSGPYAFHTTLDDVRSIAVTVEPLGGSDSPTSAPVVVRELLGLDGP